MPEIENFDAAEPAPEPGESFETARPVPRSAPPAHPSGSSRQRVAPKTVPKPAQGVRTPPPDRSPPHSAEAEEHVIACCLLDGSEAAPDGRFAYPSLTRAIGEGLAPDSFYFPANRLLFEIALELRATGKAFSLETLAEELKTRRQLEAVGGFAYLMQVTGKTPTTAHAGYFIETVREKHLLRELIKAASRTVEEAYSFSGGLEEFLAASRERMERAAPVVSLAPAKRRTPFSFAIPAKKDRSILLGNRYLNRGDGLVISGSSGIGKSSVSMQMAGDWALATPFHGIASNGALRSLIVQSEDSDGDIAEAWQSLSHVKQWTSAQRQAIDAGVRIISENSLRGEKFLRWLKGEIADFGPDLVWINPLQAYLDGDITDSQDLGRFLREGLNGLNRAKEFGYVVIHHTTKPATGKDRSDRLWHEQMYDMAGGAEIINWARGIMSLKPLEESGKFMLRLAKRGRRAGVVREVAQGAGVHYEPVLDIGLQHAQGRLPDSGTAIICWEPYVLPGAEAPKESTSGGRKAKYLFRDYRNLFPPKSGPGIPLTQLERQLAPNGTIRRNILHEVCVRWQEEGDVEIIDLPGQPRRYRAAL